VNDRHRENIRKANKQRASYICRRCGGASVKVDGSKCGGVPGVTYWQCDACGFSRAITKRK
jgi:ribosomal protein L37E